MSPKRTFTYVPAKTALVLTGSAIALAGYLGASANGIGHDGHGAQHPVLVTTLTVSPQALPGSTGNAGAGSLGTGLNSGLGTGTAGGPGTIALTAYGTTQKDPEPRRHERRHHPKHHPKHHKHHAAKHHHARRHRATRHGRRLHGSPWRIAGALMPDYHWASWQFHYLNLLWMRESGWNRFAYNHSSGAYGIPQAVPGDKMASAGPDWQTSARTQIIWGMGYIRARYGNPWNAWQHERRYGWY